MSWRTEANLAWLRALPRVEEGKPLARHTSFNIGGPADFLLETAEPASIHDDAVGRQSVEQWFYGVSHLVTLSCSRQGGKVSLLTAARPMHPGIRLIDSGSQ